MIRFPSLLVFLLLFVLQQFHSYEQKMVKENPIYFSKFNSIFEDISEGCTSHISLKLENLQDYLKLLLAVSRRVRATYFAVTVLNSFDSSACTV